MSVQISRTYDLDITIIEGDLGLDEGSAADFAEALRELADMLEETELENLEFGNRWALTWTQEPLDGEEE